MSLRSNRYLSIDGQSGEAGLGCTIAFMDAVSERIVDMIERSNTMTDDELEAMIAQSNPAVIETLQRITKAMVRGKKPSSNG